MSALKDRAGLSDTERSSLERALCGLTTLEAVCRWGFSQQPPATVAEVVVQDEYTHDVVLAWRPGQWLVFGTT